jgi:hypothetical protein
MLLHTFPDRLVRLVGAALSMAVVATVLTGCTRTPTSVGAAPATPEQLDAIRADLTARHPGTVVGTVTAVLPDDGFLAAGDVPTDAFFLYDLVSVLDSQKNTLAFGRVRAIRSDEVHVQYDPQPNARNPMEGDLVVRFPPPR